MKLYFQDDKAAGGALIYRQRIIGVRIRTRRVEQRGTTYKYVKIPHRKNLNFINSFLQEDGDDGIQNTELINWIQKSHQSRWVILLQLHIFRII